MDVGYVEKTDGFETKKGVIYNYLVQLKKVYLKDILFLTKKKKASEAENKKIFIFLGQRFLDQHWRFYQQQIGHEQGKSLYQRVDCF